VKETEAGRVITVKVYTQTELKEVAPKAYEKALNNWRRANWEFGLNDMDLNVYMHENLELMQPALKDSKLFYNIYAGQGSGVWLDDTTLTAEQIRALVPSCTEETAAAYSFRIKYAKDYNTLDFESITETTTEQDAEAENVRLVLAHNLRALCKKLEKAGENICDSLESEERFLDESEELYYYVDGTISDYTPEE
jgi:hypothetical protein